MKTWQPTDDQLLCRDLQHSWKPRTASRVKSGFLRTLECIRCTTVKEQTLDEFGYITGTKMIYPPGYVRTEGGRLTKSDRAELRLGNLGA